MANIFFIRLISFVHMFFAKTKVGVMATYCSYIIQKTQPRSLQLLPSLTACGIWGRIILCHRRYSNIRGIFPQIHSPEIKLITLKFTLCVILLNLIHNYSGKRLGLVLTSKLCLYACLFHFSDFTDKTISWKDRVKTMFFLIWVHTFYHQSVKVFFIQSYKLFWTTTLYVDIFYKMWDLSVNIACCLDCSTLSHVFSSTVLKVYLNWIACTTDNCRRRCSLSVELIILADHLCKICKICHNESTIKKRNEGMWQDFIKKQTQNV